MKTSTKYHKTQGAGPRLYDASQEAESHRVGASFWVSERLHRVLMKGGVPVSDVAFMGLVRNLEAVWSRAQFERLPSATFQMAINEEKVADLALTYNPYAVADGRSVGFIAHFPSEKVSYGVQNQRCNEDGEDAA